MKCFRGSGICVPVPSLVPSALYRVPSARPRNLPPFTKWFVPASSGWPTHDFKRPTRTRFSGIVIMRFCRPPFVSVGYCDCIEAYSELQGYRRDMTSPARVALRIRDSPPPPRLLSLRCLLYHWIRRSDDEAKCMRRRLQAFRFVVTVRLVGYAFGRASIPAPLDLCRDEHGISMRSATLPALHISLSPRPRGLDTAAANCHCLRCTLYQVFTLEYTGGYVVGVYHLARSTVKPTPHICTAQNRLPFSYVF